MLQTFHWTRAPQEALIFLRSLFSEWRCSSLMQYFMLNPLLRMGTKLNTLWPSTPEKKKQLQVKLIPSLLKAFYFTQVAPPAWSEAQLDRHKETDELILFLLCAIIAMGLEVSSECDTEPREHRSSPSLVGLVMHLSCCNLQYEGKGSAWACSGVDQLGRENQSCAVTSCSKWKLLTKYS